MEREKKPKEAAECSATADDEGGEIDDEKGKFVAKEFQGREEVFRENFRRKTFKAFSE